MGELKPYQKCDSPYSESWAEIELFRWQYGDLPTPDDTRKLDVMKGLGLLGEAVATGEATDKNNISQAIMRGAYEITRLRTERDEANAESLEQARIIGMSADREDKLRAQLATANGLLDDCKLSMEDILHHIENDKTARDWVVDCIERINKREVDRG